jgi:hypothetical protein
MLRVIAISTPVMALMAACSSDEPARGQLMVALQSDMAIPKDFNRIRVQILVRGDLRHDGTYTVSPDGTTKLPATLAVVAGNEKAPPVEVRVIGLRERDAQTFSKVITTVPTDRIATLHVPLQWLCQGQVVQVGNGTDAVYDSSCDPSADEQEQSCVFGTCAPVHVDESELPTFSATEVFGGGRRAGDPSGQCFDVQGCFRTGVDVTPNLDETSRSYCEVELDVPSGREASFAIRLPPGSAGICDETDDTASCYVPLDQSERLGWRESSDGTRAVFPRGVCDRLRDDPTLRLRMTVACNAKTEQLPTCGDWSSAPTAGVPRPPAGSGGAGGESGATGGGEGGGAGAPIVSAEPNSVWIAELMNLLEDQRAASGCSDRAGAAMHTSDAATALANLVLESGTLSEDEALSTLSAFGVTGAASYYAGQSDTLPTLPEAAFADYLAELPCDPTSLGVAVVGEPGERRAFAIVIAPCLDCGETCEPRCEDGAGGTGGTAGRAGASSGGMATAGTGGSVGETCTGGEMMCPDGCTDLETDVLNCGECGLECSAGQTCSNSACRSAGAGGLGGSGGTAGAATAGSAQGGTGGAAQGGSAGVGPPVVDCGQEPFDGASCSGEGVCPTIPSCTCDGATVSCA